MDPCGDVTGFEIDGSKADALLGGGVGVEGGRFQRRLTRSGMRKTQRKKRMTSVTTKAIVKQFPTERTVMSGSMLLVVRRRVVSMATIV